MVRTGLKTAVFCGLLYLQSAQAQVLAPAAPPARLIVRYADAAPISAAGVTAKALSNQQTRVDRLSAIGGRSMRRLRLLGTGSMLVDAGSGLSAAGLEQLAERIRRSAPEGLVQIEPDRLLHPVLIPNDPWLPNQWGLAGPAQSFGAAGINAYPAWDVTGGIGAVVAVIDTGYRPHADLAGQVVAQYDFIGDTNNSNDGDGRDSNAQDPGDYHVANQCGDGSSGNSSWHGTHVAGTVAALSNNAVGVAGVAPNAKLVIARTLGACGGYTSDIADAIVWTSGGSVSGVGNNPYPAQVINMSLSGQYSCASSPAMQAAIDSARSRNSTVVVAAGNSNSDAAGYAPASCNGVITVASIGPLGARAYYSNYGSVVDIAAPGGDQSMGGSSGILSTHNSGSTTPGADSYVYMQGTSMAAPHVAGVAALLYSRQPGITPDAVETAIKTGARSFIGSCSACGAGMIDATQALAALAPGAGALSFGNASYSVNENGGSLLISVLRSGGTAGAVSVSYASSNGTASAGSDYVARSGTLSWADGESGSKTFSITISDDSSAEASETIALTLSAVTGGATLGSPRNATISITDNDSATGALSFSAASYSVSEAGGSVLISVARTGGSNQAASVSYSTANGSAAAGSDYTAKSGILTWLAGDTASKSFSVSIANDTLAEPSETIQLRLSGATGASLGSISTASLSIVDNDTISAAGVIAFSTTAISVNENGTAATISVTRSGGSLGAVSVSYASGGGTATAGSDYTAVSGTLSWADGNSSSKSVTVPITDDLLAEAKETVILTLSNPTGSAVLGSNKTATLSINDNDNLPGTIALSSASYSLGEAGSTVTITVTRSGGSSGPASVNYATASSSAFAGSDYIAKSGTLTWANNESSSKSFTVPVINDTTREAAETFQIRLSGAVTATLGSPATAVVTINDND